MRGLLSTVFDVLESSLQYEQVVLSKGDLENILTRPEARQWLVWLIWTGFELLMGCRVLRLYLGMVVGGLFFADGCHSVAED